MPAVRYAVDSHGPGAMQRIKADNRPRNGQEPQSKQREGRQQFAHEIKLQRGDGAEQPPHPLPILIQRSHSDLTATRTHRVPRFTKILTSRIRCSNLPYRACSQYLYHLTPRLRPKSMVLKSHFKLQTSVLVPGSVSLFYCKAMKIKHLE